MQYLGIDLSNTDAKLLLVSGERERKLSLRTELCRDKREDRWYIDTEAYEKALAGRGSMVQGLLAESERDGLLTVGDTEYRAVELLARFLKLARKQVLGGEKEEDLCTVIVLPDYQLPFVRELAALLPQFGFSAEKARIISREESFLAFVSAETALLAAGEVGLFDLAEKSFCFYTAREKKEKDRSCLYAEQRKLRDAFTLRMLSTPQGERMADQVLTASAERLLRNRHFSSVILTGEGFNRMSWSEGFQRAVCRGQRKLYQEKELFARGALQACRMAEAAVTAPRLVCAGRAAAQVSMLVKQGGEERELVLAEAGEALLTAGGSFRLLPENRKELLFSVGASPHGTAQIRSVPLAFLPEREEKTCYVDCSFCFRDEHTISLKLRDAGFGEIYPPGGEELAQEVELWE